jgi:hypothetical protein
MQCNSIERTTATLPTCVLAALRSVASIRVSGSRGGWHPGKGEASTPAAKITLEAAQAKMEELVAAGACADVKVENHVGVHQWMSAQQPHCLKAPQECNESTRKASGSCDVHCLQQGNCSNALFSYAICMSPPLPHPSHPFAHPADHDTLPGLRWLLVISATRSQRWPQTQRHHRHTDEASARPGSPQHRPLHQRRGVEGGVAAAQDRRCRILRRMAGLCN